jgi:glutathione S-transferase
MPEALLLPDLARSITMSFRGGHAGTMYTLYSMQRSGNSYKVRLGLARLGVPYRLLEVDILKGESRTPEFLAMNPSGQVPLLEVAPGRHIAESNAILWYVAIGSRLAPEDRIERAEALQWMFFEQHSLEPNIGAAYFWLCLIKGGRELQSHALEDWMENGYRALRVMEAHLAKQTSSSPGISPSPTSRSTPIRMSRSSATTTLPAIPRCVAGLPGSRPSPATCRWTGSRRTSSRRNEAALTFP